MVLRLSGLHQYLIVTTGCAILIVASHLISLTIMYLRILSHAGIAVCLQT